MSILETLLLAVALAMDASAVSLGVGTGGHAGSTHPIFRIAFHFGLFQGLMTLAGWAAGTGLEHLIASVDHWVAVVLLAFVALRMIASGLDPRAETRSVDPTRGLTLIMLSIATSIDAAAGLSIAVLGYPIVFPVLAIGLVAGRAHGRAATRDRVRQTHGDRGRAGAALHRRPHSDHSPVAVPACAARPARGLIVVLIKNALRAAS